MRSKNPAEEHKRVKKILGLKDIHSLEEVQPSELWPDNGTCFPAKLLTKFKKWKQACKLIKSMDKEPHRVMAYLTDHARLNQLQIAKFDETGTLSHLLMLYLAQFEREMKNLEKTLPPEEIKPESELSENDAERQTAFSQQQFRRAKAERRTEKRSGNRGEKADEQEREVAVQNRSRSPSEAQERLRDRSRSRVKSREQIEISMERTHRPSNSPRRPIRSKARSYTPHVDNTEPVRRRVEYSNRSGRPREELRIIYSPKRRHDKKAHRIFKRARSRSRTRSRGRISYRREQLEEKQEWMQDRTSRYRRRSTGARHHEAKPSESDRRRRERSPPRGWREPSTSNRG